MKEERDLVVGLLTFTISTIVQEEYFISVMEPVEVLKALALRVQ
jgi:hypothetical protein